MPTQSCLNNIQQKTPPAYCGDTICGAIQGDINEYCHHNGLGGDVPVPQYNGGNKCWCCCSCLAWGTPIEVSPGSYKLIESLAKGDSVLVTNSYATDWSEKNIDGVGGIAPGVALDFCHTVRFKLSDGTERLITSTADHLFLVPERKVQAIQNLRPGDQVIQADGSFAVVQLVSVGTFSGGVRNFTLGPYDKTAEDPLEGHLVNANGIVSADLAVQLAYWGEEFDVKSIAHADRQAAPIGSKGFFNSYDSTLYTSFVNDPNQWPSFFKPVYKPLLNIPLHASMYFSEAQSDDLEETIGDQDVGNSQAAANFKYLKQLIEGFQRHIHVIPNWADDNPNAGHFIEMGQHYIVFTGGLLRIPYLSIASLSIIASHMIAKAYGSKSIGEADYSGITNYFRYIWYDESFFAMFDQGFEEISQVFALISSDKDKGEDLCASSRPSLTCRLQTIASAAAFGGIPQCAVM